MLFQTAAARWRVDFLFIKPHPYSRELEQEEVVRALIKTFEAGGTKELLLARR